MSLWTVAVQDATDIENAVVGGLKTALGYVDNVVVTDIEPALEAALKAAITALGQDAVAALLSTSTTQAPAA